jgi:hypothetical protein
MITGNQVVAVWREVKTFTSGETAHTWSNIKATVHCHIRPARPDEKTVSKRKDFFVDAILTTSYPNLLYRDVVVSRGRAFRVEVVNLIEGPQKTYHVEMRRDKQAQIEIVGS